MVVHNTGVRLPSCLQSLFSQTMPKEFHHRSERHMSTKVIYSMVGVGKTYPPSKQVLRDISLSYFYGAKIGVIGLNGAGKSTLLRIMAGVEKAFHGDTILA